MEERTVSDTKSINEGVNKLNKANPSQENAKESPPANRQLEEQLTHEKLMELQQIFEEADEDGGGGLDMDEFRIAMRKAMGEHLTDRELDQIFMKVDTNCDGTVDWDEYLTYMLLECQEKDTMSFMNQDKYVARTARMIPNCHKDSIIRTLFMPSLGLRHNKKGEPDYEHGKFATVGKDGITCFWSSDMKLLSTQKVEAQNQRSSIWITDCIYMPKAHMLALSTTNREILFYDVNVGKFNFTSRVTELEDCPTCMFFTQKKSDGSKKILIWGDSKGSVGALEFDENPQFSPFHLSSGNNHRIRISFAELMKGSIPNVKSYYHREVHDDLIRHVQFYEDLQSFISCCRSDDKSMCMSDINGGREKHYYLVPKGIYHFEYSSQMNIIISGGYDAVVRVWNPYVTSKPIILIQGHKSPIIYVTVNVAKELIVSISETREIMVHEMATQKCMQTVFRKMVPIGPRPISSVCFNHHIKALLVTSNKIAFFKQDQQQSNMGKTVTSHEENVTAALYNPLFEQVVSVGEDSLVCVWDIHTGARLMQYGAHKIVENGEEVPREITAVTFDPTYRRLMTAGRDNYLKIWNFNNGACLREIDISKHGEVTEIICQKRRIVIAGWSGFLEVYVDDTEDDTVELFTKYHRDDITSVAYYPPYLLASADNEGLIYLWSMETRRALYCFNPKVSIKPISPGTGIDVETNKIKKPSKNGLSRGSKKDCKPKLIKEKRNSHGSGDIDLLIGKTSVDKLVFLRKRDIDRETATLLSSGADGWVRAWSTHPEGGLLAQFPTKLEVGTNVLAMSCDQKNEYLVTGDDSGYIKVWDIAEYCVKGVQQTPMKKKMETERYKKFIYIQEINKSNANCRSKLCPLPPAASKPRLTVVAPPLLNSYQGHVSAISCVNYVDSMQLIVSASTDCTIRLWTVYGNFVGIFGDKEPWHIPTVISQTASSVAFPLLSKHREQPSVPEDVRRVASTGTLRVLKQGVTRRWKLARDVLRWLGRFSKFEEAEILQEEEVQQKESESSDLQNKEILGKWYKPTMKHHKMRQMESPRQFGTNISVFSSLPVYELKTLDKVEPPQSILDIQARQQLMNSSKAKKNPLNDLMRGKRMARNWSRAVHYGSKHRTNSISTATLCKQRPSLVAVSSSHAAADTEEKSHKGSSSPSETKKVSSSTLELPDVKFTNKSLGTITEQ